MKIHFELEENETCVTPIKVVEALIMSVEEMENPIFKIKRCVNTFDLNELMEIAEHLQIYCKYNRQEEVE